jgi:phage terminase large subunit-like protein/phage terminase small subunit
MASKALVKPESDGLGPAMKALSPKHQRFVLALFENPKPGSHGAIAAAARAAGYGLNSEPATVAVIGQQIAHREDVQAAIAEYTRKEIHKTGPAAVSAVRQIVSDPLHKDRLKAANVILERITPTVQRVEVAVSVAVDHTKEALEALRYMKELNVPRQKLLEHFGHTGLPRYERMLAEQEVATKGQEIVEAEFKEIPPNDNNPDWGRDHRMNDDTEFGPDANQMRRHAKRMLTELEYRKKYCRIDFYKPNPKQLNFHNLTAVERMLRAGNQLGKTTCCAAEITFQALGIWPEWYKGLRHVKAAIERPFDFVGWAASTTSTMTRDGCQLRLLGDITQKDGLGQGLIPLDFITGTTMSRGISGFVDTVTLRREGGGTAAIRFKTFEMDRQPFQSEPVDLVWLDEDPGDDVVWGECLARLTATKGRIMISMTPVLGRTAIRKRFDEPAPERAQVRMRLADALHIDPAEHAAIRNRYKASERATRADGDDLAGSGAVFEINPETLKHHRDPKTFPHYWPWIAGVDFSHGGMSASAHPFAYVLACVDPDNDVVYITEAWKMSQALPIMHVARIKEHPCWDAPICWPADGQQSADAGTGMTFAGMYRKHGLNMLSKWSTFKDGSVSLEAGVGEIEQRMATGRLKVAAHLHEWFEEMQNYHREDLKIVAIDDDLLGATRQIVMQLRSAKVLDADRPGQTSSYRGWDGTYRRKGSTTMAKGLTFADHEL